MKNAMKNKKMIICYIVFGISVIVFFFSLYHIVVWYNDNKATNRLIVELQDIVKIKDTNKTITTEVLDTTKYYDEDLLSVDFTNLLDKNEEVVGWIEVPYTNINYPFVQHNNNTFYLNHSFDKSYNGAGWVYLDYRNKIDLADTNTIIYAHGRVDGTMFGSLKNVLDEEWIGKDKHIIKVSTLSYNYLFEIFSVYHIKTTNDYLVTNFSNTIEYQEFIDKITSRSMIDFGTEVTTENRILTLSTCYNNREKVVVHGKLVKQEKRY